MVVASIVLGVGILVVGARSLGSSLSSNRRSGVQSIAEPTTYDHWHEAFAVDVCGTTLAPLVDRGTDQYGIHTHGDGVIHVHPFTNDVAGANATFGVFANQVGMVLGSDQVRLPDGTTKKNGDDCNGAPGRWQLVEWDVDDPTAEPVVRYSGFESVRFTADRHAFTLAFLPSTTTAAQVPKPSSIPTLDQLTDAPSTTTTRRPGSTIPRGTTPTAPTTTASTTPPTTNAEQGAAGNALLDLIVPSVDGLAPDRNALQSRSLPASAVSGVDPVLSTVLTERDSPVAAQRGFGSNDLIVAIVLTKLDSDEAAAAAVARHRTLATTQQPDLVAQVVPGLPGGVAYVRAAGASGGSPATATILVELVPHGPYLVEVQTAQRSGGPPLPSAPTKVLTDQLARLP